MTDIIVPAKVHGRSLELTDSLTSFGLVENEELFVVIKKKRESVVEKTAGKEMDEDLINASVELTELGE
ncbi:MAG: hypothetical protein D4R88_04760 [Methanosarcinales archaeon]|nr:MAG: hypothetical protein D4R88_04760 [Methanosarcinales archaeon]